MTSQRPFVVSRSHTVLWLVVLLVGFGLRIFELERMPPFVHGDGVNLAEYSLVVARGEAPWYGVRRDGDTNWAFLQYAPYALLGGDLYALRFMTVCWSMVGLAAAYYAIRQMFGASVALYALWLLAVSHMLVHFGRVATIVIPSVLTSFLAIGLYLKAQRWQDHGLARAALFTLAGAVLALNLYEYVAARTVFFAIAALWLLSLPRWRVAWHAYLRDTVCLTIGFFIVATPILWWYMQRPVDLFDRMEFLSVFNPRHAAINLKLYGSLDTPMLLYGQTLRSVGAFFVVNDTSPNYHFDAPLMDLASALLMLPGLVLAWRRNTQLTLVMLVWLAAGLIAGSILLVEPPTSYHYIVLVPLVIIFAALSMDWLARSEAGWLFAPLLVVGISWVNIHFYFTLYPTKGAWYSLESAVGLYARTQQDCCDIWFVGELDYTPKKICLLAAAPATVRFVRDVTYLPDTLGEDKPAIVIVPPDKSNWHIPTLKRRFPQGHEQYYTDRGYWMFDTYRLSRLRRRTCAMDMVDGPCIKP